MVRTALIVSMVLAGAAILTWCVQIVPAVRISRSDGSVLARIPLESGSFAHHFVHSVHRTAVDEMFGIAGPSLHLTGVFYDTYGVGMPSDEGEGFSISADGRFHVKLDRTFDRIVVRISPLPDHGIVIDGTLYRFSDWAQIGEALVLTADRIFMFHTRRGVAR
ncbi:MAG: DUF1850 domain-containing protein [Spirochaetales bacterium]|nr:DUF1850 domain-containing protein [Spirochaetales bacterium]